MEVTRTGERRSLDELGGVRPVRPATATCTVGESTAQVSYVAGKKKKTSFVPARPTASIEHRSVNPGLEPEITPNDWTRLDRAGFRQHCLRHSTRSCWRISTTAFPRLAAQTRGPPYHPPHPGFALVTAGGSRVATSYAISRLDRQRAPTKAGPVHIRSSTHSYCPGLRRRHPLLSDPVSSRRRRIHQRGGLFLYSGPWMPMCRGEINRPKSYGGGRYGDGILRQLTADSLRLADRTHRGYRRRRGRSAC